MHIQSAGSTEYDLVHLYCDMGRIVIQYIECQIISVVSCLNESFKVVFPESRRLKFVVLWCVICINCDKRVRVW